MSRMRLAYNYKIKKRQSNGKGREGGRKGGIGGREGRKGEKCREGGREGKGKRIRKDEMEGSNLEGRDNNRVEGRKKKGKGEEKKSLEKGNKWGKKTSSFLFKAHSIDIFFFHRPILLLLSYMKIAYN